MSKREMKPIIVWPDGAFFFVRYPYRKTQDMYCCFIDHPVFCCQCGQEFELKDLMEHIRSHDKRRGPAPIVAPKKDGKLYYVKGFRKARKKGKTSLVTKSE